ncbi:GPW family protein [Salmonella phage 19]|nr:GPW family protein [Salmonella phage 19]
MITIAAPTLSPIEICAYGDYSDLPNTHDIDTKHVRGFP